MADKKMLELQRFLAYLSGIETKISLVPDGQGWGF